MGLDLDESHKAFKPGVSYALGPSRGRGKSGNDRSEPERFRGITAGQRHSGGHTRRCDWRVDLYAGEWQGWRTQRPDLRFYPSHTARGRRGAVGSSTIALTYDDV